MLPLYDQCEDGYFRVFPVDPVFDFSYECLAGFSEALVS